VALPFYAAIPIVRRAHASPTGANETKERVGTAHDGLPFPEEQCQRLCPPYNAAERKRRKPGAPTCGVEQRDG